MPRIFKSVFTSMLLILIFLASSTSAQQKEGIIGRIQQVDPNMGSISINQDPKIAQLLDIYYLQNASKPGMQGFRIRIFFDLGQQSRTNSLEVMNEFMENFPGISVYRTFDSPYYKVSVGDFRSQDEALKYLKMLSKKYPKAFIISDWINFPRLD